VFGFGFVNAKSNSVQNCLSDTEIWMKFTGACTATSSWKSQLTLSGRPSNEQVGALNGRETPVAYSCDDAVQVSTRY